MLAMPNTGHQIHLATAAAILVAKSFFACLFCFLFVFVVVFFFLLKPFCQQAYSLFSYCLLCSLCMTQVQAQ